MTNNEKTERKPTERSDKVYKMGRGLLQALLTFVIIAVGILVALMFIKLRKPPQRVEQEVLPPLVKVQQLHVRDIPMVIQGYGTASPKVEVEIVPEVSGKVVSLNPQLKAGGFIPAKEQILKIDPRDYELAVQQAQAAVAEAQVRLDIEMAEAEVARREWQQLHPNTEPTSPLVLREPQIRQAQAALESARAQLATAELKLERTSVFLPFDALIISEKVDLGQYVVAGQPLGVAYGVESVEIEVPLEDEELAWFDAFENSTAVNGSSASSKPAPAYVKAEFAGAEHTWKGYVMRTTGQVDRTSRMVSVVVEVPKPFDTSGGKPPLLPGAFVEVFIEGKTLENAVAVPRDAIHDSNKVWLVNDGRLHIQPLEAVRADKDFAYVVSGVDDKAMIVLSTLDTVVEGMQVRIEVEK
ncbi:MAG: efflux RND transporter periplasmic adaptor subunit [Sedimentisphaerales bacterium]